MMIDSSGFWTQGKTEFCGENDFFILLYHRAIWVCLARTDFYGAVVGLLPSGASLRQLPRTKSTTEGQKEFAEANLMRSE